MLALKSETRDAVIENFPHYMPVEIPQGTYKGVDMDIPTVCTANLIMVDADLDNELVYNITRAIFENIDKIYASHPSSKDFTLESAIQGSEVPFHPGSIRYFKEKGVWKRDLSQ